MASGLHSENDIKVLEIWSPFIDYLKRMKIELMCEICKNVVSYPNLLPCNHILCSDCMDFSKKNVTCPSCSSIFMQQDVRNPRFLENIISIFTDIDSIIGEKINASASSSQVKAGTKMPCKRRLIVDEKDNPDIDVQGQGSHNMKKTFVATTHNASSSGKKDSPQSSDTSKLDVPGSIRSNSFRKDWVFESEGRAARSQRTKRLKVDGEFARHHGISAPARHRVLFQDSCAFCHSFRLSLGSGPMMRYIDGKLVPDGESNCPDGLALHEKCVMWAPQIYYNEDKLQNLELELERASKLKCKKCGEKGAALGCYYEKCRRSYHVPCAVDTEGCRWDSVNYLVLCPNHVLEKLPCDDELDNAKKVQIDKSLPTKVIDVDSPLIQTEMEGREEHNETNNVYIGSALSDDEQKLLDQLRSLTVGEVTKEWMNNVTHIIASKGRVGAYKRTHIVLMGILNGLWVIDFKWVKTCLEVGHVVDEEPFEVTFDVHGYINGPRKGRLCAKQQQPRLFTGLTFYVSKYFPSQYKSKLEELIATAGGSILTLIPADSNGQDLSKLFIIYNEERPDDQITRDEVLEMRSEEAATIAANTHGEPVGHTKFLDAIAEYNVELLRSRKSGKTNIIILD